MSRSPAEGARALVLSERGAESRKWHALQYEFEDVIAAVDDVALLAPPGAPEGPSRRLLDRVYRRAGHPERVTTPALRPVRIVQHHELFFTTFSFVTDVPHLLRLRDLRKRCDIATCFFVELFSADVSKYRRNLELLRRFEFDRVYVFNPAPKDDIAEIVGCPVEFLPLGVDAFLFSPYPSPPARTVDLYQFGRRSPVTHAAALEMARRDGVFYLYDTIFNVPVPDYRAHRRLIAEQMKRSRYFFANKASIDLGRGAADDVLSSRYFEATAGGAVLLGSSPATPEWDACFDWEDAVIDIPYEAHDLREIVADLDAQPERLERARQRNIVGALRRHDWVYRWAQILDDLDLPHSPAMTARMERLEALAALAEQRGPADGVPGPQRAARGRADDASPARAAERGEQSSSRAADRGGQSSTQSA